MSYKQSNPKLSEVFWCNNCLNMSTRPRIKFDDKGWCNACQWMVEKKTIDWKKKQLEFKKLLKKFKSKDGYDCIVPVSGGKDGSSICHTLKTKYGVNPLAVTVRPPIELGLGIKNLQNFVAKGFDHIHITPNRNVMQQLDKLGFLNQGFAYFGWYVAIFTAVTNLACRMGINLIIYAEDGEIEYGGKRYADKKMLFDVEHQTKIFFEGGYYDYIKKVKASPSEKCFFLYPPKKALKKLKYVFFSHYHSWDPYKNYLIAKKHCGLKELEHTNQGTFTNFAQNDQSLYLLHCYLMYLKFGFGRATQDAGIEIRRGAMTREQAVNLVKLYDGKFPEEYIDSYIKYYKINKKTFFNTLNKFCNKNLFEFKNNKFIPKFEIK